MYQTAGEILAQMSCCGLACLVLQRFAVFFADSHVGKHFLLKATHLTNYIKTLLLSHDSALEEIKHKAPFKREAESRP